MKWTTINKCGKIVVCHKQINLTEGKITTGTFLNEILEQFARVSTLLFDTIYDWPFAYRVFSG